MRRPEPTTWLKIHVVALIVCGAPTDLLTHWTPVVISAAALIVLMFVAGSGIATSIFCLALGVVKPFVSALYIFFFVAIAGGVLLTLPRSLDVWMSLDTFDYPKSGGQTNMVLSIAQRALEDHDAEKRRMWAKTTYSFTGKSVKFLDAEGKLQTYVPEDAERRKSDEHQAALQDIRAAYERNSAMWFDRHVAKMLGMLALAAGLWLSGMLLPRFSRPVQSAS